MLRSLRHLASLAAIALTMLLGVVRAQAAPRVVIVGVDGASWSVIDLLLAQGKLPHFAALLKRGVHANLATVEPVISPVVWTSIATGQPPEVHGIGDFFGDAREIAAPSIFERLAAQGLRVGTYEWLVTWPPRPLPGGFVIPDWLRRDGAILPSDAFVRAGVSDYRYSNVGITTRDGYHRTSFRELAARPARWNALARAFELDAGAVSFYAIDALSHRFWGDSFPAQFEAGSAPPPEPQYARTIEDAYVAFDRALGEIVAALPPECAVIVASDHGFRAAPEWQRVWSFQLRSALADAGLREGPDTFEMGEFAAVTARVVPGDFAQQDALLERLVALLEGAKNEAGAALFSVWRLDGIERPDGRERSWSDQLGQWAFRQLARFTRGIEFDQPAHAWIVAMPNGEALEAAWPKGRVRVAGKMHDARELIFGDGFSGTHHPTAVFAAAGGAVRHDAKRGELSVLDIAPLYAYLAGAQIPDDLPGKLATHWIEPRTLAGHPPRFIPASALKRLPAPAAPAIPDAVLLERLRAMGYVE